MAIYLTEADVEKLVNMQTALSAVEQAHIALSQGKATDIPRQRVRMGHSTQQILQAGWPEKQVMGYKAYTTSAKGCRFWVYLFDSREGRALAVIEADLLGMMRTGAAGGIAAQYLARDNAKTVGVIGAGWQAKGQILALALVRPIEHFKVYARNTERLVTFCAQMSVLTGIKVTPAKSAQDAVLGVDIVVTATNAAKPVLEGSWLSAGVHINAMGSNSLARRELDEALVKQTPLICVDSVPTALLEAGDLLPGLEKGHFFARQFIELGDIAAGVRSGRVNSEQTTLFESQGMAIQDLALGLKVLEQAQSAGIGQQLPY